MRRLKTEDAKLGDWVCDCRGRKYRVKVVSERNILANRPNEGFEVLDEFYGCVIFHEALMSLGFIYYPVWDNYSTKTSLSGESYQIKSCKNSEGWELIYFGDTDYRLNVYYMHQVTAFISIFGEIKPKKDSVKPNDDCVVRETLEKAIKKLQNIVDTLE